MRILWWKSALVTVIVSFIGSFSFAQNCSGEGHSIQSSYVAVGIACIGLTIHRLVLLIKETGS